MAAVITLCEQEEVTFSPEDLDESTAMAIYERYGKLIAVDFPSPVNCRRYLLRAYNHIGYLPLSDNLSLRIDPKVPISNVFGMLEYAYQLKSFRFFDGLTDMGNIAGLFESLALILSRMIMERCHKGLYCNYVEHDDPLPYLRGRINVAGSLRAACHGSVQLSCEYTEHTANVIENKVLAYTLSLILRHGIRREDVRREIRQSYFAISGPVETTEVEASDFVNLFYNRLNEDYRPMHGLCRFFLEQSGPAFCDGDHKLMPFVLDMASLFESFVAEWLKQNLPAPFAVKEQHNVKLTDDGSLSFKIDLLLTDMSTGKTLSVMDTKYKKAEQPSSDDIEQIIAYTESMGAVRAFLIYPSTRTRPIEFHTKNITGYSVIFDMSGDIEEAGQSFLSAILTQLKSPQQSS